MLNKIPIEVSARHIHLSQRDVDNLFGKGYKLTPARFLSEPQNFVCRERITLETHLKTIDDVAIIGPIRNVSQIELALTDCRELGIKDVPVRGSGEINLAGTPGINIRYGQNKIHLNDGVIVAWRHIHINQTAALELNLTDGQLVKIKISGPRAVIFENVLIRVRADFVLGMQIDTDEANAAGIGLPETQYFGELIK